jgi:hypothetical protein
MTCKSNKKLCPFVKKPFNDCYCFNMTSKNIYPAIAYCSNNFSNCSIYRKNSLSLYNFSTCERSA